MDAYKTADPVAFEALYIPKAAHLTIKAASDAENLARAAMRAAREYHTAAAAAWTAASENFKAAFAEYDAAHDKKPI